MSEERACYCDSRQCDICTPYTPGAPPRGDLWNAAQMLAGDNARLCGIVIAADKLAEQVALLLESDARTSDLTRWRLAIVRQALDAYKIVRQGQ